jgi:hypothetical protein
MHVVQQQVAVASMHPHIVADLLPHLLRAQGCASDRLIDTAVLGGPKVFVVATLASERPAAPFAFRNYELPEEAAPAAAALAACNGSCKHHVWEVGVLHLLAVAASA